MATHVRRPRGRLWTTVLLSTPRCVASLRVTRRWSNPQLRHTRPGGGVGWAAANVGTGADADAADPAHRRLGRLARVRARASAWARRATRSTRCATARRATPRATLELWNDADIALREADSFAGLLSEVHPDADVRALAEQQAQEVDRIRTDRGLDRGLYDAVAGTDARPPGRAGTAHARARAARLPAQRRRPRRRDPRPAARDLRAADRARPGLLPPGARGRALDPPRARAARRAAAGLRRRAPRRRRRPGDDHHRLPDYLPFRTFARDADARRELAVEFLNRGWPAGRRRAARDARPARREGPAARLRQLARLRRRGQDGRHGRGDRRVHRQAGRGRRPGERARTRRAAGADAARRPGGRRPSTPRRSLTTPS